MIIYFFLVYDALLMHGISWERMTKSLNLENQFDNF